MAAVEGGRTEIVSLITGLKYNSQDPKFLEKSKMCKDGLGNTALHIAYKKVAKEMHKILLDS